MGSLSQTSAPSPSLGRGEMLALAVIGLVAFLLRLGCTLELRRDVLFDHPVVDQADYADWGRMIAQSGYSEPEAFPRPPGIAYALALLFRIAGPGLFWPRVVQALLSSACCLLVFGMARRLFSTRIALAAACLVAVHAVLVHASTEIMPTTWVTFFDALALYCLVRAERSAGWAWPLASGVVLGISALFLPTILLFVPVAVVALWKAREGKSRSIAAGAALLGVALTVLPVTVRNYVAGGETVLVAANDGINFYIGNNADYDRTVVFRPGRDYRLLDWEPMEQGYRRAGERSAYFYRKALRFVRTEPGRALGLSLRKLYLFFDGPEIPRSSDLYLARGLSRILAIGAWHSGVYFPDGLVMPLALVGIAACWRERRRLLLPLGFAATQVAGVCAFFVSARYRAPSLPVWSLFAVAGAAWLAGRVRRGGRRERFGLLGAAVGLAVALNVPTRESRLDLRQEELFYRGQASLDAGQLEGARGYLEAALAAAPSDGEAWNLLGDTRSGLGDVAGGLEAWRRSTSCDPTFADPWRNIARTQARQGDLDGAIQTLQSSLAHMGDLHNHGNDYGVDLVMLASFWSQKGDLERALRATEQALELDPTNAKAKRWKAQFLSRLGRTGAPPGVDTPPHSK